MSKNKSKIAIADFKQVLLRGGVLNSEQSQINIFIDKEKKTALKLFSITNNSSVNGVICKLIDLFLESVEKEKSN